MANPLPNSPLSYFGPLSTVVTIPHAALSIGGAVTTTSPAQIQPLLNVVTAPTTVPFMYSHPPTGTVTLPLLPADFALVHERMMAAPPGTCLSYKGHVFVKPICPGLHRRDFELSAQAAPANFTTGVSSKLFDPEMNPETLWLATYQNGYTRRNLNIAMTEQGIARYIDWGYLNQRLRKYNMNPSDPSNMKPWPSVASVLDSKFIESELSRWFGLLSLNDPPTKKKTLSFPLFSHLPKEIRLVIWDMAMPARQMITIKGEHLHEGCYSIRSPTKIPRVLHVCRESRKQALQLYHMTHGAACKTWDAIYLNNDRDTVVLFWDNLNMSASRIANLFMRMILTAKTVACDSLLWKYFARGATARNAANPQDAKAWNGLKRRLIMRKAICYGTIKPKDLKAIKVLLGDKVKFVTVATDPLPGDQKRKVSEEFDDDLEEAGDAHFKKGISVPYVYEDSHEYKSAHSLVSYV